MRYYLAIERNVLSSHKNSWRNLSEKSQPIKTMYCNIPNLWHCGKDKTMDIVKRLVFARDGERKEGANCLNTAEFYDSETILCDTIMDLLCICQKPLGHATHSEP